MPDYFLVRNGLKGNLGFEAGLIIPVVTDYGYYNDAEILFVKAGVSRHLLGYSYGIPIVSIGEKAISSHRHNRYFLGFGVFPFRGAQFIAISATAGYGSVVTNYSSNNINGKIKVRTGDISLSISVGLNKYIFE